MKILVDEIRKYLTAAALALALTAGGPAAVSMAQAPAPEERADTLGGSTVEVPRLEEGSSLDDYLVYAAQCSPELRAAWQRWQAALAEAPQAGALPDPQLTYSTFIRETGEMPHMGDEQHRFMLSQGFPLGRRGLRRQAARQEAEAMRQELEDRRQVLFFQVRQAYYDYYLLAREIAVTRENTELLRGLEEVVRRSYSAGGADYSGLLQTQVELGRLEDRLASLEDRRAVAVAELNRALGRPVSESLPEPAELPEDTLDLSREQALELVESSSPALQRLRSLLSQAETNLKLARRADWPELMVGLDYTVVGEPLEAGMTDAGRDPLMAVFAMNLPLWRGKYRAAEQQAASRHGEAAAEREQMALELRSRLVEAFQRLRDSRRKIVLYREGLVPRAEQALGATSRSFSGGTAGYGDQIEAQRTLLELELELERAQVERAGSIALIRMLLGGEQPGVQ